MKPMNGVQITMSFWKSILNTIPDFFELLEKYKNYSYYFDTVKRDLKFTNETLVVTPPDELCHEFELRMEGKHIPFIKAEASLAGSNVRAMGFYAYYCRTLDIDRIQKVVEEINQEVMKDSERANEGQEKENPSDEQEVEIDKDEVETGPESAGEAPETSDEPEEPEDEFSEDDAEIEEKNSEKKKKKDSSSRSGTSTAYDTYEQQKIEQEKIKREQERLDAEKARENERRLEEEKRQEEEKRDQQTKLEQSRKEAEQKRERDRRSEAETRDHELLSQKAEDHQKAEQISQGETEQRLERENREESTRQADAQKKYQEETDRRSQNGTASFTSDKYENTDRIEPRKESSDHSMSRGQEVHRAAGADSDSSIAAGFGNKSGFYWTDAKQEASHQTGSEPGRSWSGEEHSKARWDPNAGSYTQDASHPERKNQTSYSEYQSGTSLSYEKTTRHEESRPAAAVPESGSYETTNSRPTESVSSYEHQESSTERTEKPSERSTESFGGEKTDRGHVERSALASGRRDVNVDFSHKGASAGESAVDGGAGKGSSDHSSNGGIRILGTAETMREDIPQKASHGMIRRAYERRQTDLLGAGSAAAHDVANLAAARQQTKSNSDAHAGSSIGIDKIRSELSQAERAKEILKRRHINDIKEVISPRHVKQFAKSTGRMLSQATISRETDGGRVANEIIDNVSPIASAMFATMLANGAINLTRQTTISNDILSGFYQCVHGCSEEEARGALAFLTRANIDSANGGSGYTSMYSFERSFKLDNESLDEINERILALEKQIRGLQSRRSITDADLAIEVAELKQKLGYLRGQRFLAKYKTSFYATEPGGFGLHEGEAFSDWFGRVGSEDLVRLLGTLPISEKLKDDLASLRLDSNDTIANLQRLLDKYAGNSQDTAILKALIGGKMVSRYRIGSGGIFNMIRKGLQKNLLKTIAGQSDAGRALGEVTTFVFTTYGAYRAGMTLFIHALRQFGFASFNASTGMLTVMGKQIEKDMLTNPIRTARKKAMNTALDRIGARKALIQTKRKIVQHASSALKFLTKPVTAPIKKLIVKIGLDKVIQVASAKFTAFIATASSFLGWALVVFIVICILGEIIQSTQKAEDTEPISGINNSDDIVQEVISELTQKNSQFMADINDAANHRGEYSTTVGIKTNENVSFYETYNIVFRDAETGTELEPSHVDLNNTKAILSMASKMMPYPLIKPGDNATEQAKKDYEDMAQHFKDYCYFLWASTHQISIEEYHPGNSEGVDGAVDTSGMVTAKDTGKCDKDGTTIWLQADFTKNVTKFKDSTWICQTCSEEPETGLGLYRDDLCTHGKDDNPHGGWRMTGNYRWAYNCQSAHNHRGCNHDEGECNTYTCEELSLKSHRHKEYEWVYECGGHMGAVVYVTIGDLSRDPSFPAAKDVDYDAVGQYNTGDSVSGDDVIDNVEISESAESAGASEG